MSLRGRAFSSLLRQRVIPISLADLREIVANDIPNTAANGGLLASDTTPILQRTNGATDPKLRVSWAAGNVDPVSFDVPTPQDIQPKADIFVDLWLQMGGATDTPVVGVDLREGVGDANFGGNTAALSATLRKLSVRGKGSNVFGNTPGFTVTITPAAHATDALRLTGVFFRYTVRQN